MISTIDAPQTADSARQQQLREDGFCVFEQVLSPNFVTQLRVISEELIETRLGQMYGGESHRAQGSLLPATAHPLFAQLIAHPAALQALARLGYDAPTYSDGYIISKPGHSPRLFWHYDWFAWEDESSFDIAPQQLFAMVYLSDTRVENGCLRVIPGSHVHHNPLHDLLREPHSKALSEARDMSLPEFSTRLDERSVPVKAGDLLIGDARLLHAAHANQTDTRRTLITLWYQPDLANLPPRVQAQMAVKTQIIPADWPDEARQLIEPLLANRRYNGDAQPYGRSLYRRRDS